MALSFDVDQKKESIGDEIKTNLPNVPFSPLRSGGGGIEGKIKNTNVKRFFLGVLIGVFAIFILAAAVFGLGIYRLGWSGETVKKITKVLPYPAVFVNWRAVRFSDYEDDVATLKYFFETQGESAGVEIPEEKEMRKDVLDRLIKNEIANQLAKKYGIKVSDEDLEAEFQKVVAQEESVEKVAEALQSQYRWSIEQFKTKVIWPFLVQQKLEEAISKDENLNQETKRKAEEVLAKVKSGEKSFLELAQEYSEDGSAAEGGDLGFFGKGAMVPGFEKAAFSLGVGEVSDLVLTEYGYHIIKLEEQKKDDAGEVTEVRARHILIRTKSLDKIIEEEISKAKVWQLIEIQ